MHMWMVLRRAEKFTNTICGYFFPAVHNNNNRGLRRGVLSVFHNLFTPACLLASLPSHGRRGWGCHYLPVTTRPLAFPLCPCVSLSLSMRLLSESGARRMWIEGEKKKTSQYKIVVRILRPAPEWKTNPPSRAQGCGSTISQGVRERLIRAVAFLMGLFSHRAYLTVSISPFSV